MSNTGPENKVKKEKKEKKEKHGDIATRLSNLELKETTPPTDSPKVRGSWIKHSPTTLMRKLSTADQGMPPIPTDPLPQPPNAEPKTHSPVLTDEKIKKTKKEKKHHHKDKREHRRAEGSAPKDKKHRVKPVDSPLVATVPLKRAAPPSSTPRPAYVGLDDQPQIDDLNTRALAAKANLEVFAKTAATDSASKPSAPILTAATASRRTDTQASLLPAKPVEKRSAIVSP